MLQLNSTVITKSSIQYESKESDETTYPHNNINSIKTHKNIK